MALIEDLYEVRENIRRGQTDDWDADMITAAIRALEGSSAAETVKPEEEEVTDTDRLRFILYRMTGQHDNAVLLAKQRGTIGQT